MPPKRVMSERTLQVTASSVRWFPTSGSTRSAAWSYPPIRRSPPNLASLLFSERGLGVGVFQNSMLAFYSSAGYGCPCQKSQLGTA
jgi:hypothetical protein